MYHRMATVFISTLFFLAILSCGISLTSTGFNNLVGLSKPIKPFCLLRLEKSSYLLELLGEKWVIEFPEERAKVGLELIRKIIAKIFQNGKRFNDFLIEKLDSFRGSDYFRKAFLHLKTG